MKKSLAWVLALGCSVSAEAGVLVTTEILYNMAGDDAARRHSHEWIEIFNTSATALDLGGYVLRDAANETATLPAGARIGGQSHAILYNGSLLSAAEFVAEWWGTAPAPSALNLIGLPAWPRLNNNGDTLRLYNPSGVLEFDFTYNVTTADGRSLALQDANRPLLSAAWAESVAGLGGTFQSAGALDQVGSPGYSVYTQVTPVPLPGALALFASALVGGVGLTVGSRVRTWHPIRRGNQLAPGVDANAPHSA